MSFLWELPLLLNHDSSGTKVVFQLGLDGLRAVRVRS
jgi:hypothetical protein